ncbi:MAG: ribosomal protection-like ABC-F family protein [Clostridiales bacterium]
MLILEANNIEKYYGERLIIKVKNLKIYSGEKIGIVGINGVGKSTLLDILASRIDFEKGNVKHYSDFSYIKQFSKEEINSNGKILKEFNLTKFISRNSISGGEETKIKIVNALSKNNRIVFADEPTSNLDYGSIELLTRKLLMVDTLVIISHDRNILNKLCNKIIEIEDGELKFYSGNYSEYKKQKEIEFKNNENEYNNYIEEKLHLESAVIGRKKKSKSMKKTPKRMGNSEARLHKRKVTEKQEKVNNAVNSLKTRLEKLEKIEKPKEIKNVKIDFTATNPPKNKVLIYSKKMSFNYGPRNIFQDVEFEVLNKSKIIIYGENGSGKTTLLNLIYNQNENIKIVPKAKIGYYYQDFRNLDFNKNVLENVMESSVQKEYIVRTVLARFNISKNNVYKNVNVLSGGERIKVSMAKLFVSDANILFLDEPTNYMDVQTLEVLEEFLINYEGTVIIVSHDKDFINKVGNILFMIKDKKLITFSGNLNDYEYNINKKNKNDETEKVLINMKLAEIVSKLSHSNENKEFLELEYQRLIKIQRELDNNC